MRALGSSPPDPHSLLCDDMARVGLRRAVCDPNVATTYGWEARAALADDPSRWERDTGIRRTSWAESAEAPIDWDDPQVRDWRCQACQGNALGTAGNS